MVENSAGRPFKVVKPFISEARELASSGLLSESQQLLGTVLKPGSSYTLQDRRAASVELAWTNIALIRMPLSDDERIEAISQAESALNLYASMDGPAEEGRALNARAMAGYGEVVLAKSFFEPDLKKKESMIRAAFDIANRIPQPRAERAHAAAIVLNTTIHKLVDELIKFPENRRDPKLYEAKKYRAERMLSLMERRGEVATTRVEYYLSSAALATWAIGLAEKGANGLDKMLEAVEIYSRLFSLYQSKKSDVPPRILLQKESLEEDIKKTINKNTAEA